MSSSVAALRVLLVDDSRDSRTFLSRLLQRHGFAIAEAIDGEQALAIGYEFRPDCVISDLAMPNLSGYGLARELRRRSGLDKTLLVAYSAYVDPAEARAAGFDYWFVKPTPISAFLQVLKEFEVMKKRLDQVEEAAREQGHVVHEVRDLMKEVKSDINEIKTGLQEDVKDLKVQLQEVKEDVQEIKEQLRRSEDGSPDGDAADTSSS
ncbi:response regulator [Planctomyces sp. SH-PL14]|uniref:response regulator n=1 Tax=Planctomyces sp. SH-PL14 TaxID=1632864 RepID=UPI00094621BE|nr:response regulator [Planctomyces sp. SH-PL14]